MPTPGPHAMGQESERRLTLVAAECAAKELGLGQPAFHGVSGATTYTTPRGFLRVVRDGHDSPGTTEVARYVTSRLGGGEPLADAMAYEVDGEREIEGRTVVEAALDKRMWEQHQRDDIAVEGVDACREVFGVSAHLGHTG